MISALEAAAAEERRKKLGEVEAFLVETNERYKERLIELSHEDSFIIAIADKSKVWYEREFIRYKIERQDYDKAREMMRDFSADDFVQESDRQNALMLLYQFLAKCYLHMTEQEFQNADWEELKDILAACEYRTEHSIVPDSRTFYELFFFGSARPSQTEKECFEMYRLWKKWNTKPWEINGGHIYPEDIRTVLEIEKIEQEAQEREQKKQQSRQRLKSATRK